MSENHASRDPKSPADERPVRFVRLEPVNNHQGDFLQKILRLSPIAHKATDEPAHRGLGPSPLDRHALNSI